MLCFRTSQQKQILRKSNHLSLSYSPNTKPDLSGLKGSSTSYEMRVEALTSPLDDAAGCKKNLMAFNFWLKKTTTIKQF